VEITDVADDEFPGNHGLAKSAPEVIENDHPLAGFGQLLDNVASDVPGTAGD
jgi:hypothetical protein